MADVALRLQAMYPNPDIDGQAVSVSSSSVQSAAVGAQTKFVKLAATQDMYLEFGANPTAVVVTSMFIAGDKADRYYMIRPGDKIAAIRVTNDGILYISEMTT